MIFSFTGRTRYYFYHAPVDMRKGIHSLYHMVKTIGQLNAFTGDCYIFMGRTRKTINPKNSSKHMEKDGCITVSRRRVRYTVLYLFFTR